MEIPPKRLDGAVVLHYVTLTTSYRPTGAVQHYIDGIKAEPFMALAICQYAGDQSVYLFYCDADWKVISDDLLLSVPDAFREAEREYEGLTESGWSTMADSARELEEAQRDKEEALAALPDDYAADDTIRQLVSEGQEFEAIARLRQIKGQSLFEAFTFVRQIRKELGK